MPGTHPAVAMLARSPFAAGKTRLTAGLAESAATVLRVALLLDTIEAVLAAGWPVHVYLDPPGDAARVEALLRRDAALASAADRVVWHPQAAGDLGARMVAAAGATLAAGHDVVVLAGSDIPDLPRDALLAARDALRSSERRTSVALGPADDGGFYLVAATDASSLATAFAGVTWSRPAVLGDVTARLAASGHEVAVVRSWADVDDPKDLETLRRRGAVGGLRTRAVAGSIRP